MPWTVIALLIGLGCSIATYLLALRSFDKVTGPLRNLIVATGILYVCLAGAGTYVYLENDTTQRALCTFREDLDKRIEASTVFLEAHPHGIPGIPVGTIKESLHNQERTSHSLGSLSC